MQLPGLTCSSAILVAFLRKTVSKVSGPIYGSSFSLTLKFYHLTICLFVMIKAMSHHIIYVPGLGDSRTHGQNILLQLWRLFGLKSHYFALDWADKQPFAPKLQRLLGEIDRLQKEGQTVSLVGVSAGASAVLNAYSQRKSVAGVVCIAGKIQNPQTVSERTYATNPAFKESMAMVKASLDNLDAQHRQKIMSIHPLADHTVPITDTIVQGAVERAIPVKGHVFSIFYAVIFGSRFIANFLKTQK